MVNRRKRILIVDDCKVVLRFMSSQLTLAGYQVLTRDSPIGTGMTILRFQPDLVFLDVEMPSLAGDEVLAMVRRNAKLRDTVIILFSGRPEAELKAMAQRTGANGFLCKTNDLSVLLPQIEAWLKPRVETDRAKISRPRSDTPNAPLRPLFVEDDVALANTYRRGAPFRADYVASAEEAMARIASARPPSLVITDLGLPTLSGQDLFHWAVQSDPSWSQRFLFITGQVCAEAWIERFVRISTLPVFFKPVQLRELAQAVATMTPPTRGGSQVRATAP